MKQSIDTTKIERYIKVKVVFPIPPFNYVHNGQIYFEPGYDVGDELWIPEKIAKILTKLPYVEVVK